MLATRLKRFLNENHVHYSTLPHALAYTALGVAATTHVSDWSLAKTVALKVDGTYALAVVPAASRVDLRRLGEILGAGVALATEAELQGLFPGCEVGAMPPFGNLYGLRVYVDAQLAHGGPIAFNAGTHSEAVRMHYADFERLVDPMVARFSRP